MRIFSRVTAGLSTVALTVVTAHLAGEPLRTGADAVDGHPFSLTVDSIMRGPKLVGYPPTALRWSGDSSRLTSSGAGRKTKRHRRGWWGAMAAGRTSCQTRSAGSRRR